MKTLQHHRHAGQCLVEARGLEKWFDRQHVLHGIDLCLRENETIVILGKSGTGKSVFLQTIVGLIKPDAGSLHVLGTDMVKLDEDEDADRLTEVRRNVGFLFQGGALYDSLTVEENLKFAVKRQPNRPPRQVLNEMVDHYLESVGLPDTKHKKPADLSGGMRKRIALARTLMLEPKVMLYDEPTTGLDPASSREISHLIREQQEQKGISGIVITHDMPCAEIVSDRIVMFREGRVYAEGTYRELALRSDPWIKSFFTTEKVSREEKVVI